MTNALSNGYNWLQLFFASALGGIVASALNVLWQNFIAEKFDRRKELYKDKRLLADEIIKICTEASVSGYTMKPRSIEHVYYVMTQVAMIDPEIAENMETMLSRWMIGQASMEMNKFTLEGMKTQSQWVKEADEKREAVLNKIANWKK